MEQYLELIDVSYRYKSGNKDVLSGLSCAFESGSISAVMGHSGSGKTTLLSLIAGLDRPTSGEIRIGGDSYASIDLDMLRRERIGMVFQAFNLLPVLTVMENVCYPAEMLGIQKKQAKEKAAELLKSVGIGDDLFKRYPSRLSGGEQQRVAIARALSSGAQLLLADEPTGNLDEENAMNVMSILGNLAHDSNYCVVIVSHSDMVAERCDCIYRLANGVLSC